MSLSKVTGKSLNMGGHKTGSGNAKGNGPSGGAKA